MTKVAANPERFIGRMKGAADKPALVFIGGVHGNEPSGVTALEQATEMPAGLKVNGSVYALYGNKWAPDRKVRFDKEDLNRIWTRERILELASDDWNPKNKDESEQQDLWNAIQEILDYHSGPIYFMDLHTTSSETKLFIVLNYSLLNRSFTEQYPLPIILGIEEYLDGPLLSYINELGYIAFGFEAGSHNDPESIKIHYSFIVCSLGFTGLIKMDSTAFQEALKHLQTLGMGMDRFYEIFFRYKIREEEQFVMHPGFVNFQAVKKGEKLVTSDSRPIYADRDARVFMPLYQSQGSEGFFAIRPVEPPFFFAYRL